MSNKKNNSQFIEEFLNIYHTMTKMQKKVFKYFHWYFKKFRHVFTSLFNISKYVKCCEKTVTRCTNYFEKMGWITKIRRGYRSNDYFINEELLALDLDDPTLFYRGKCPHIVPVLESSSSEIYNSTNGAHLEDKKQTQDRHIPEFIKIKELSHQDQQRLANKFPEYALVHSMNDFNWYKKGHKIKSYIALIWDGAKRYCST